MKRIFTILVAIMLTASVFAQAPEKMTYQLVVRDASSNLITSTQVGIEINIYQGSATGTLVYTETQTPTTNANGLLTIEIGGQTGFDQIDWASGPYFIETNIDVAGGTNYTITGTSQLLSVPYALHAKTAENITGGITETDPVYTNSQAANITATDITNLSNLSGTNTGDQDISGIAINTQAIKDTAAQIRADIPVVSGFITTETDPVYSSSVASGITATDTTNWHNKLDSYTETDPIFRASVANGITAIDTANWNNHTVDTDTHIDSTGIAGLGYVAGAHTDSTAITNMGFVTGRTYAIGDFAQGGIVFWVDETGKHGLVCAKSDLSSMLPWYAGTSTSTMARGDGPYSGELNTALIIASQSIGDSTLYAALACSELQITEGGKTYGDWYLPSLNELTLMYQNRAIINTTATANGGTAFVASDYWSSTEITTASVNTYRFAFGIAGNGTKNYALYVRAIRAF